MEMLELKSKILKHFEDPLKPVDPAELGEAAKMVEFPTRDRLAKGGLSPEGEVLGKLDPEIGAAAAAHREASRLKINAVTATCLLFTASKTRQLGEVERGALISGIRIGSGDSKDYIKTTRKNGRLLTPEFKEMMSALYKATKDTRPDVANAIIVAANLQKKEEQLEQEKTQDVPAMA
jgi:hypothetical protein